MPIDQMQTLTDCDRHRRFFWNSRQPKAGKPLMCVPDLTFGRSSSIHCCGLRLPALAAEGAGEAMGMAISTAVTPLP
jgi:hypothetical protein